MHIHAIIDPNFVTAGTAASIAEEVGFDGVWTTETAHDPFLPLVPAAASTSSILIGTAIAVAFPRSPTHLAVTANDLQVGSGGRFVLGLGSQVRAHVERRFSAEFEHPIARMRELVSAVRGVWDAWDQGVQPSIDGRFYRIDLMPPAFSPPRHDLGRPPIYLSAVGDQMAGLAGEVADGVFVHGFSTAGYLRDVTRPAVNAGADRAGRHPDDITIARPVFVATGRDRAEIDASARPIRNRLGFYGSTPAYRRVLEHEGWDELGAELRRLVKAGRWAELGDPITDEVLDELAIVAPIDEVAAAIVDRFDGLVDRLSFNVPYQAEQDVWAGVLSDIHHHSGRGDNS